MTTTYEELYKRVLLRLDRQDGEALLAAKEAVNTAHKVIARVIDFDELIVLDTTNAETVADKSTYHLVDDWGLTRPKDIFSMRYMDETESRKLQYKPARSLDSILPYTLTLGTRKPYWYTTRGYNVELIPVPAEDKPVYIHYSQWPLPLSADTDETSYLEVDDVIIELGADIGQVIISKEVRKSEADLTDLAKSLLSGATREERTKTDRMMVAQPFRVGLPVHGEYWKHPFVRHNP